MTVNFSFFAVMTLDGRIALDKSHNSDWSSQEDKKFLRSELDKCDVIIVGNNTYKIAFKPLSKRKCIVLSRKFHKSTENCMYVNPRTSDLNELIRKIGYKKVAVLGGTQIFSYFLKNNMADDILLTVEPIIFGKGLPLFNLNLKENKKIKLISLKRLNRQGTILLHYRLKK